MGWFRNRHKHVYRIAGVYHEVYLRGPDRTTVLYRCSACGHRWTEAIDGFWTKDQLLGKAT